MAKFTIQVDQAVQIRLNQLAGKMNSMVQALADEATANLAQMTYTKAHEMASNKLNKTADQYKDALKFETIAPGVYSVTLGPEAYFLEEGYGGFDMRPGLLRNAKKRSKLGYRYRSIPFQQKSSGVPSGSKGDMLADLKRLRSGLGDKGLTRGPDGKVLLGKVWSATPDDTGAWNLNPSQPGVNSARQRFVDPQPSKNLHGLVKYQYGTPTRSGGMKYNSAFVTYRTISENPATFGPGKWQHPGYDGAKIFPQLHAWAMEQLTKVLDELFAKVS